MLRLVVKNKLSPKIPRKTIQLLDDQRYRLLAGDAVSLEDKGDIEWVRQNDDLIVHTRNGKRFVLENFFSQADTIAEQATLTWADAADEKHLLVGMAQTDTNMGLLTLSEGTTHPEYLAVAATSPVPASFGSFASVSSLPFTGLGFITTALYVTNSSAKTSPTLPATPSLMLASDSGFNPSDGLSNNPTINVLGLESALGTHWQYQLDGTNGHWLMGTGSSFTASAGAHSYFVQQIDADGNASLYGSALYTLDTTPPLAPSLKLDSDTGFSTSDGLTNNPTIQVLGLESALGTRWQYQLDGTDGNWLLGTGASFTASAGAHRYFVQQMDGAGNASLDFGSAVYTLNTTPPLAPSLMLASDTGFSTSDGLTNNPTIDVLGLESALGTRWQYQLDGTNGNWLMGTGTSFTASAGAHSYFVQQIDAAGNASLDFGSAVYTLDTTPPLAPSLLLASDSGFSTSDGLTNNPTINVLGLESALGTRWQYQLDGTNGNWLMGTGTSFTASAGAHRYFVQQMDGAGNASLYGSALYTLDTTPPLAPSLMLASDSGFNTSDGLTNNPTINVLGLESALGTRWQYQLDGTDGHWLMGTGASFTASAGAHSYFVQQIDAAGNASLYGSALYTLDTTPPLAPSLLLDSDTGFSTSDGLTNNPTIQVLGLETSSGSTWSFQVNHSTGSWSVGTGASFTATSGTHLYFVQQVDAAGNVSPLSVSSYTLDTSAPSGLAVVGTTNNVPENSLGAIIITANPNDVIANAGVFWSLGSGGDTNLFVFNNGVLSFISAPNYEMPRGLAFNASTNNDIYTVNVTASDAAGNVATQRLLINVIDVDEAPIAPLLGNAAASINELFTMNASFTDPDILDTGAGSNHWGDLIYTVSGLPAGLVIDSNTGLISGRATVAQTASTVTVTATDGGGLSSMSNFTLQVVNGVTVESFSISNALNGDSKQLGRMGNALNFTLNMSEVVTVNTTLGTPSVTFSLNGSLVTATYSSGTNSAALIFTGNVPAGNGHEIILTAINLNGATVSGASGQHWNATAIGQTEQHYTVDNTPPVAPSLMLASDTGFSASDRLTNNPTINVLGLEQAVGTSWQYQVDSSAWTTGIHSSFTATSGAHSYFVRQTDAAGNVGMSSAAMLYTLDTSLPSAPIVHLAIDTGLSGSDGITTNPTVQVLGLESGASWAYQVDGANWVNGTATNFVALNSNHSYSVQQIDLAGNTSPITRVVYNYLNPPVLQLLGDSGANVSDSVTMNPTISVLGLEVGVSWQYQVDGGNWIPGNGNRFIASSGTHSYAVRQIESYGNTSNDSAMVVYTVDNTPPSALSFLLPPLSAGFVYNTLTSLPVSAHSDGTVSHISFSGGVADPNPQRLPLNKLPFNKPVDVWLRSTALPNTWIAVFYDEGFTKINLVQLSENANGSIQYQMLPFANKGSRPNVFITDYTTAEVLATTNFYTDSHWVQAGDIYQIANVQVSNDVVVLTHDNGHSSVDGLSNDGLITINGLESGASWQYSINSGQTWQLGSGTSFNLTVGSYAAGQVRVRQIDLAGNVGNMISNLVAITIEQTLPPQLTMSLASDTGISASDGISNNPTINIFGLEQNASWLYQVDGGSWMSASGTSFTALEGAHVYSVIQIDEAGNSSTVGNSQLFILDSVAPHAPRFSLAALSNGFVYNTLTSLPAFAAADGTPSNINFSGGISDVHYPSIPDAVNQNRLFPGLAVNYWVQSKVLSNTWIAALYGAGLTKINLVSLSVNENHVVQYTMNTFANVNSVRNINGTAYITSDVLANIDVPHNREWEAQGDFYHLIDVQVSNSQLSLSYDTGDGNVDGTSKNGMITITPNSVDDGEFWQYSVDAGNTWMNGSGVSFVLAPGRYGIGAVQTRVLDFAGNISPLSQNTQVLTIQPTPTITSVAITASSAQINSVLLLGSVVSATVQMSAAVSVNTSAGIPQLALNIGNTTVQATYAAAMSTSTALIFTYTIRQGLLDSNGISIPANALSLNGGTIWDATENNAPAVISHSAVADNALYQVDAKNVHLDKLGYGFSISGTDGDGSGGFSVSNAGDVNGDGLIDLIIGAPYSGKAYLVFGKADLATVNLSLVAAGTGGFVINGTANDLTANSVAVIGDINGDGLSDFLIGSPNAGAGAGKSYVVFGKTNHSAVNLSAVAMGSGGFVINGHLQGDASGYSVASAGDVNGDGIADLLIGAPSAGGGAGKSYVVFGTSGISSINLSAVENGMGGFVIVGQATGIAGNADKSGFSVSGVGDLNGDGLSDLIIAAPFFDRPANLLSNPAVQGGNAGASYVVFGKANTSTVNLSDVMAGSGGFIIYGINNNDMAGYSVACAGDVNGDGVADFIVGAPFADKNTANNDNQGTSYVVFGKANTSSIDLNQLLLGTGGFVINGKNLGERAGYSVSAAGDFNGDGMSDLLMSTFSQTNTTQAYSYLVYGKNNTTAVDLSAVAMGSGGFIIYGETLDTSLQGMNVADAGDINGDGFTDLLLTSYQTTLNNNNGSSDATVYHGKTYIVFGGADYINTSLVQGNGSVIGRLADEMIVGSAGNDTLTGGGGVDRFFAGAGNDIIVLTQSDINYLNNHTVSNGVLASVDGGSGIDTLRLLNGSHLDLTAIGNFNALNPNIHPRIHSIEKIDLSTDSSSNALTLNLQNVINITGFNNFNTSNGWTNQVGMAFESSMHKHQLLIEGAANDSVQIVGGGWSLSETDTLANIITNNGHDYYYLYDNGYAQLLINSAMSIQIIS